MNILFVCTGNVNRSFVAEKYAAHLAKSRGAVVSVDSAGVAAQSYYSVPKQASGFLKDIGLTEFSHAPKLITEDLVNKADLILVMENLHYDIIADKYPQASRKMHLFLDYLTGASGADLADPMGKSDRQFRTAFETIKTALDNSPLFTAQSK